MYQIGDKVVYGMHGVCIVTDMENHRVDGKQVVYLVLEPIGQSGSRYLLPSHNNAAMAKVRPILSKDDLEALLTSEAVHADIWIRDENQRKQCYRELISGGDRQKQCQMVCSIYRFRRIQVNAGKKIHLCDDNFLRDAEKQIASEISVAFHMDLKDALQYLREKLKEDVCDSF